MESHDHEYGRPLSALLRELSELACGPVSVEQIMHAFGGRAFGAVLFMFSTPIMLPLPPGASTVLGAPLLLIAPQVALGVRRPWLPRKIRERTISGPVLARTLEQMIPWVQRVERISRPRLRMFFGRLGDRLIGMVCTLLALVLILPVPFGNMLPAAAVGVLALALALRDGLLAIAGYALAASSVGVLVLAAGLISRAIQHVLGFLGMA